MARPIPNGTHKVPEDAGARAPCPVSIAAVILHVLTVFVVPATVSSRCGSGGLIDLQSRMQGRNERTEGDRATRRSGDDRRAPRRTFAGTRYRRSLLSSVCARVSPSGAGTTHALAGGVPGLLCLGAQRSLPARGANRHPTGILVSRPPPAARRPPPAQTWTRLPTCGSRRFKLPILVRVLVLVLDLDGVPSSQ